MFYSKFTINANCEHFWSRWNIIILTVRINHACGQSVCLSRSFGIVSKQANDSQTFLTVVTPPFQTLSQIRIILYSDGDSLTGTSNANEAKSRF